MSVPNVKRLMAMMRSGRRPKRSESETRKGWKTALVRRYDAPIQKASVDVPWRSFVISCRGSASFQDQKDGRKGDASHRQYRDKDCGIERYDK
jgi:hypothetical protein